MDPNAPRFDAEWTNAIFNFVVRDFREELERVTKQQTDKIERVHAEGWKNVARAIETGLGAIARAIEGRR